MRAGPTTRPGGIPRALPGMCLLLCAMASTGLGQVGPAESARRIKPAEGLEASLWASEPMVVNPTNIDIDSRGRVWVTEGLNYRLTRSGNARFHRIEDADKIKILEDTDGDGKADRMTVFADRVFPVPMGIAVEEHFNKDGKYTGCRVFVGNSPNLLVLEDTDGDDKADRRYPLLSGFGGIDSDHGVHGMVLGLDGKLYFTQGDGCCSVQKDKSERQQNFDVVDKGGRHVKSDQLASTLRANRDGTEFEVICDRQRNNYETSLNSFGNIFTSDNDDDGNRGCRVIWAMDGGRYGYRTPGSPRHWGEDVPGNIPKLVGTGNGSPAGIMVYEGDLLPKDYFGAVLEVDAGTRQVNFFPITRTGASFRTDYKVFLASDDPWFRPIDACAAPDGSVLVADWYDAGVGGHAFSDQTTGRIYRVVPKGQKGSSPKSDFGTIDGLIAALRSPNVATQDAARRGLIAWGEAAGRAVHQLAHDGRPEHQARALWVAAALPKAVMLEPLLTALSANPAMLRDHDPRLRELLVRMLGRDCRENGKVEYTKPEAKRPAAALANLNVLLPFADDPDAGVRRELILALRNLPTDRVGGALKKLAASWDGRDRRYLEALGLAIEKRKAASSRSCSPATSSAS
ncbi:MAG: PVC-type heme-binding CxxCH protein [Isosphaeraceae bacterium]